MERRQAYAIVGAILFMSGLFKHFHFWAGTYDMTIVLVLTAATIILTWRRIYRGLLLVSVGALGSLAYTIVTFRANMEKVRAEHPGLETIDVTMLDWAIPLAGVVLLLVAALINAPPSGVATHADPAKATMSGPTPLARVLSAASTFLPLIAIGCYSSLREMGFETALYGMSVAIAASFWELRWQKRFAFSLPVAVLGLPLWATFDVLMIIGIALAAGAISVGYMPTALKRRWWANLLYRLCRMAMSGGLAILAASLNLSNSGRCPSGGGDITEIFMTFVIMTYLPVGGMIAMDGIAKFIEYDTEKYS